VIEFIFFASFQKDAQNFLRVFFLVLSAEKEPKTLVVSRSRITPFPHSLKEPDKPFLFPGARSVKAPSVVRETTNTLDCKGRAD